MHSPKLLSPEGFGWKIGIPVDELEKLAKKAKHFYHPFVVQTGTKTREIAQPKDFLKDVQTKINSKILQKFEFPQYIVGGIKGRNPISHAQFHLSKAVVVTIDIKDCYPRISHKQIFTIWRRMLNFSPDAAHLATKLTTYRGALPLGAPTSNALANLALLPAVTQIFHKAKRYGFTVSQYVDDQALSGAKLPDELITEVINEFTHAGFKVNRKKIKVMRSNKPQYVTNKLVNKKRVTAPLAKRKQLEAKLHKLKAMPFGNPSFDQLFSSLKGNIHYLKQIHESWANRMLVELDSLKKADREYRLTL